MLTGFIDKYYTSLNNILIRLNNTTWGCGDIDFFQDNRFCRKT